jgi:hypothetical protein
VAPHRLCLVAWWAVVPGRFWLVAWCTVVPAGCAWSLGVLWRRADGLCRRGRLLVSRFAGGGVGCGWFVYADVACSSRQLEERIDVVPVVVASRLFVEIGGVAGKCAGAAGCGCGDARLRRRPDA